ncbi:MAG: hypothetical protein HOP23_16965 [Methylococcaceae bacterium]|nr:hypothetical protein [Methylococcaceae bacterium]
MNTPIDERGHRFFSGVCEFKNNHPHASSVEIDRYIEKELCNIFGDELPPDQKISLAAFGRAWRHRSVF